LRAGAAGDQQNVMQLHWVEAEAGEIGRKKLARANGTVDLVSDKLPALQAYQYQLSLAAPAPPAGSFDAAAATRGKAIFEGKGQCAGCHAGARFTDANTRLHPPAPRSRHAATRRMYDDRSYSPMRLPASAGRSAVPTPASKHPNTEGDAQMARTTDRRTVLGGIAAAGLSSLLPAAARAQGAYPNRPVTVVCPWGAGGGTDATARIVSAILEKSLGQPFNVVNRTGGSGVVGHSAIATAPPDGYTLGMITVEITMMHHQGLTELKPTSYTPLALMNVDPPGVQVNATSPYKSIKDLAAAIKAAPAGKFKASGTGQGGIWHLALIGWLQAMGLPPNHVPWVPSNGAAPAMQDLAAGGIDIVTCSVPEAKAMIDAGKAVSLAVMAPERNPAFKDVPTLNEALGINYSVGAWRGIAGPKGLPPEIANKLTAELKKVYDSAEFKDFMKNRGFGTTWADPAGFAKFMDDGDKAMGVAMTAAGLKKS
jgi:tripartite-type tricarboxylate transporter receptor subunit TctC